ncbi:hypothetical protein [Sneathiella chinensis]|uniref:Flagellar FliJ protein n=1 Tax=Sneathiella chinensis TaxID=349750 RepID=A0ABQ5U355_9PROT|nr:hypothetical protein [Sneathiella chinensis]GLQ05841.1 hypothetical protein GCM10007924_10620 [Sneathiella chinensis]
MKSLKNLIRVQQWKLDEKRRVVSDMEGLLEGFRAEITRLDEERLREQEIAVQDPILGASFGAYATAARTRRENLLSSIAESERQLVTAREELAELFQELKRYEITEETRLTQLKQSRDKMMQEEMDELSIELHRRKNR